MGRKADPSRAHFDEVSEQTAGPGGAVKTRKRFKCVHCGWKMQRSSFAADVGRAHLAADKALAQNVCTVLCTATDDDAATRHRIFQQEIKDAAERRQRKTREKRRQRQIAAAESVAASAGAVAKKQKQGGRQLSMQQLTRIGGSAMVDQSVGKFIIANNIAPTALDDGFAKEMFSEVRNAPVSCGPRVAKS